MPRRKRIKSRTNVYHVVCRGINRQLVFEAPAEYRAFLNVLKEVAEVSHFSLHAYAIMGNHVHLLIETPDEDISIVMKRILLRFSLRYNGVNQRVGHLWQNRYFSEPVEDLAGLRKVFRYIHRNPIKAGLEKQLGMYPWTSLRAYRGMDDKLTCTDWLSGLFENESEMMEFLREENEDICMDIPDPQIRYGQPGDRLAADIMEQNYHIRNVAEFQNQPRDIQRDCISTLKQAGISIRAISRKTGESCYRIRKI